MFSHPRHVVSCLRLAVLVVSALFVLGAAGCGQKGPLYVPADKTPPPATRG